MEDLLFVVITLLMLGMITIVLVLSRKRFDVAS
jgi:hypothetical protein